MFEELDRVDREMIYKGLKELVENGDGSGFHNRDKGHPFYVKGAAGNVDDDTDAARERDRNRIFAMLKELSLQFKEEEIEGTTWWYDFSDWKSFCQFVVDSYNRNREQS